MLPIPPALSRTSSTVSTISDDGASSHSASSQDSTARRTRKRFSHVQLMMLERLFHNNSHPTRAERESVAKAGGMEMKSVTIWFQNKRQIERKVALHNRANSADPSRNIRNVAVSSSEFTSGATIPTTSLSLRPSLDKVASRSELRVPAPRTPSRRYSPHAAIWEQMPSSPLAPPTSPPAREYVEFGKKKRSRTLEWACAAARLAEKEGGVQGRAERDGLNLGEDTEDEIDEAPTPSTCTWEGRESIWTTKPEGGMTILHKSIQDDDMIRAALALCGLGRRQ